MGARIIEARFQNEVQLYARRKKNATSARVDLPHPRIFLCGFFNFATKSSSPISPLA